LRVRFLSHSDRPGSTLRCLSVARGNARSSEARSVGELVGERHAERRFQSSSLAFQRVYALDGVCRKYVDQALLFRFHLKMDRADKQGTLQTRFRMKPISGPGDTGAYSILPRFSSSAVCLRPVGLVKFFRFLSIIRSVVAGFPPLAFPAVNSSSSRWTIFLIG